MNVQQPAATTQPEENGTPAEGKTFTQEEVNQIVRERLAREKAKAESITEQQKINQEKLVQVNQILCKDYLSENKYPEGLLNYFDTSDAEKFKESVEKLAEAVPRLKIDVPNVVRPSTQGNSFREESLASIFKPKT